MYVYMVWIHRSVELLVSTFIVGAPEKIIDKCSTFINANEEVRCNGDDILYSNRIQLVIIDLVLLSLFATCT